MECGWGQLRGLVMRLGLVLGMEMPLGWGQGPSAVGRRSDPLPPPPPNLHITSKRAVRPSAGASAMYAPPRFWGFSRSIPECVKIDV